MAKKKAVKKKSAPKKKTLNFKVYPSEAAAIKTIARKWTRGNVTALAKLAIHAYAPKTRVEGIRASTR